jgi:hypothetical protein
MRVRWSVPPDGGASSRPVPYSEFAQMVRRYPRVPLLRKLAATSAQLQVQLRDGPIDGRRDAIRPFTVAGIARTALRAGNEHRNQPVAAVDVARLSSAFISIDDPAIEKGAIADGQMTRLLARMSYEQFSWQYSPMENIGRTIALLLEHNHGVLNAPTPDDWKQLLGVELEQFMNIGFAVFTAMCQNEGAISRDVLTAEHVKPIWEPVGHETAMRIIDQHFVTDLATARADATREEQAGFERWSLNPLTRRPLLAIGDDLVAPAAHYIVDKITPASLYFAAAEVWDTKFTTALGGMFEAYVGSNLRLIAGADVLPEIVYGVPEQKSCDFIVVLDEVVLLVEAKSARPSKQIRLGDDGDAEEIDKKIGHARDQLERTARLIKARDKSFAHIPADRPLVGLIVTLEPFHLRQTMSSERVLGQTSIPIELACAHDLEGTAAGLQGVTDAGARLLDAFGHADVLQRNLRAAAKDRDTRNPILDAAWDRWAAAGPVAEKVRAAAAQARTP